MSNWISVKDALPSDGGEYLVVRHFLDTPYRHIDICGFDAENKEFGKVDLDFAEAEEGWYYIDDATHWMRLPEMPEEGKDA